MHYDLKEIFNQASKDPTASPLHGIGYQAYLLYGIKINRDNESGEIEMLDTSRAGDFYSPVTTDEMKNFHEKGWRYGIYVISLSNYRVKLDRIEKQIKKYVNSHPSRPSKQLDGYQTHRTNILQKYSEITNKLNKLKSNQNGKINTDDI